MNKALIQAEMQVIANSMSDELGMPVRTVELSRVDLLHPRGWQESPLLTVLECFGVEGYPGHFAAICIQNEGNCDVLIVTDGGYQVAPRTPGDCYDVPTLEVARTDVWEHICVPFISDLCNGTSPKTFSAWLAHCDATVVRKPNS